jgi:tyrosine-protein kinase Etk/Wzc
MNQSIRQISSNIDYESDSLGPGTYIDLALENRWLIIAIAFVVTLAAAGYAFLAVPVYEANILIQVDNSVAPSKNILSDMATPNDSKMGAASEMEILRSRRVVSRAVDNAKLYLSAEPKYFPGIGEWIARGKKQLSIPGLFGYGGYAWGAERMDVSAFDVPGELEGSAFQILALGDGKFLLRHEDAGIEVEGRVGTALKVPTRHGELALRIDRLAANPGTQFVLVRSNRLEIIERLQNGLSIAEKGKQSGIIGVSLQGADPKLTSIALNEIGREYIQQNEERKAEDAEKSLAFLDKQLPSLKQELERSETEYNRLRNIHGTVDLGEEAKSVLQQTTLAQSRMIELRQKKEELLIRFQEAHPAVQGIEQQMRALNRELATLDARTKRLPAMEQELFRLTRDVKVNTEVYTAVLSMAQQLRLASANKVGNARLLDTAAIPVKPVKPRRLMLVFLGGIIGLVLGGIAVYIKKFLFGRVDSPYDIERLLGLPVSATIPHSESRTLLEQDKAGKIALLSHETASDGVVESLRGFRAALQFSMQDARNNIVMITGPTPGVGKSFVSANFATVLASVGKKVLLIDADLRTGHLHRYFGVPRKNGLSDAIMLDYDMDHAIHRNAAQNIDFISTGDLRSNPAELLGHQNFGALLHTLSHHYDVVLIDTAPVLSVSDPLTIAPHAGTIFNVVRSGVSTAREIAEAVKQLNRTGRVVTGTVLNDLKPDYDRYGYGNYRYTE